MSRFALGVAPAIGVLLAVLISMFVFLLNRWATDGRAAVNLLKSAADSVYQLCQQNSASAVKYLDGMPNYLMFAPVIAELTGVASIDKMPSFVQWRTRTATASTAAVKYTQKLTALMGEFIKVSQGKDDAEIQDPRLSEELFGFHTSFAEGMFKIDGAIQLGDWAKAQRRIAKHIGFVIIIGGFTLVWSLLSAFTAEAQSAGGISDAANVWIAGFLLVLVLFLVIVTSALTRYAWGTSDDWIRKLVQKLRKERGSALEPTASIPKSDQTRESHCSQT